MSHVLMKKMLILCLRIKESENGLDLGMKITEMLISKKVNLAESEEELKSLLMKVKEEMKKLAKSSTFRKLRSWHLVPSLHGK